jgi:hypothetical protein
MIKMFKQSSEGCSYASPEAQEHIKIMQTTRDMNKCQGKYICMNQSSNKGIYKDYVKKDTQSSFKTMNIELLGIFQNGISS